MQRAEKEMDGSDYLLSLLSKMDHVLPLQGETCACPCFLCFDSQKKARSGWLFVCEVQPSHSSGTCPGCGALEQHPEGCKVWTSCWGSLATICSGFLSPWQQSHLEQSSLFLSLLPRSRAGSRRLGLPLAGNGSGLSKCLLAGCPRGQ